MSRSSSRLDSAISETAEAVFLNFLGADGAGFEDLCNEHPELELELRWLQERHARAEEMLHGLQREGGESVRSAPPADGRYEVLGEIAHGGMGRVLEVRDRELDRVLALKVLRKRKDATPAERARQRTRMVNEALVLGRLEHPGIVPIHEVGSDPEGRPYFTMLRVRGRALDEIFKLVPTGAEGWSTTRVVDVLLRVCEAVAHAHAKGIVHRDLKPANVMVGPFGEVYVMDWGLAKMCGSAGNADIRLRATPLGATDAETPETSLPSLLTVEGDVLGTPSYMSPEQARGAIDAVGERSDVYGLGSMLYHLLSGRAPYVTDAGSSTPQEILRAVRSGDPEPLERIAPEATGELASVCAKAMARDPAQRYASMRELAEDLRAFLENRVVRAHATGAFSELRKWMRRHRAVVALLGALLALLVGLTAVLALLLRESELAARRLEFLEQSPAGHRMDYSGIPTLESFVDGFDDDELDRPLRVFHRPGDVEERDGRLVLHQGIGAEGMVDFGLDDSLGVIRGDFELSLTFDTEGFVGPTPGVRVVGLAARRVVDGALAGWVCRKNAALYSGSRFDGFLAGFVDREVAGQTPCSKPSGTLHISRNGKSVSAGAACADGELQTLFTRELTDDPLQFFVWVTGNGGDRRAFQIAFEELSFVNVPDRGLAPAAPVHEAFADGMPEYLVPVGDAGTAAVIEGRLLLMNFARKLGGTSVHLDTPRYGLRGDFDVGLEFALTDLDMPAGTVLVVLSIGGREGGIASTGCEVHPSGVVVTDGGVALPEGQGALRLRRVGSRVSALDQDGDWREVATCSTEDLSFKIEVYNSEAPAGAEVAIDNLRIEGLYVRQ